MARYYIILQSKYYYLIYLMSRKETKCIGTNNGKLQSTLYFHMYTQKRQTLIVPQIWSIIKKFN